MIKRNKLDLKQKCTYSYWLGKLGVADKIKYALYHSQPRNKAVSAILVAEYDIARDIFQRIMKYSSVITANVLVDDKPIFLLKRSTREIKIDQ